MSSQEYWNTWFISLLNHPGLFIYTVHCISVHKSKCTDQLARRPIWSLFQSLVLKIRKRFIYKKYRPQWKPAKIYYSLIYKYINVHSINTKLSILEMYYGYHVGQSITYYQGLHVYFHQFCNVWPFKIRTCCRLSLVNEVNHCRWDTIDPFMK